MRSALPTVSAADAALLLLDAQGLRDDAARAAGPAAVLREIERLGFVQLDSINVVERAHHHILWSRLHRYRPATLARLQREGRVFEHWTHDASLIPSVWFGHWRHRFADVESWAWSRWLTLKLGEGREALLGEVLARVRADGPLRARDFEDLEHRGGAWWDWKPAKAALEYLWRGGALAIGGRVRFEKVYDLTERVLPQAHGLAMPPRAAHVAWACRGALDRLGLATAREVSGFWAAVKAPEARAWLEAAQARGEVVRVQAGAVEGRAREAFAPADWPERLAHARELEPAAGIRILSPFDPLVRDRARCLRLFGFDYRFEAFTPKEKRVDGYYVLPLLEGARLVGRLDPKLDREAGLLRVRRLRWEPGVRPTRARRRALEAALQAYAAFNGATGFAVEDGSASGI